MKMMPFESQKTAAMTFSAEAIGSPSLKNVHQAKFTVFAILLFMVCNDGSRFCQPSHNAAETPEFFARLVGVDGDGISLLVV